MSPRLDRSDYAPIPSHSPRAARRTLVRSLDGERLAGVIVETEAYCGPDPGQGCAMSTSPTNGLDLTAGDEAWIERADAGASGGLSEAIPTDRIVNTTRVGIDSAGPEWAGKRWRWYDGGSAHISRR
jgi:3-methyladenine DNA glycosylase Mpg